ncbi:MAG: L,D-transpeptidase [Myxococcales bacterium]|nr:L,D-transpeptidase [Myxococcales bacterium]
MLVALHAAALGCDGPSASGAELDGSAPSAAEPSAAASSEPGPPRSQPEARHEPEALEPASAPPTASAGSSPPSGASPEPPPRTEPLEHRRALRPLMVYVEPRLGAEFRGKIPLHEVFELYERVPGEDCGGEGWGRVAAAAYVCLHHSEPTDDTPMVLPRRIPDGLAPFYYARLQPKDASGNNPPAPRYRSRTAMRRGAAAESFLEREHDYAFVDRRRFRDGAVLYAHDDRVVRESDVLRKEPSDFAGRDTLERPIPEGAVMGWSITWPHAIVRAEPHADAEERGRLPLHEELLLRGEPRVEHGETWQPVESPAAGWVLADEIRWWVPMDPPTELRADEIWLDVDLDQQMLALRRGPAVEMLTLVSSGNWKHGTPVGLFRIEGKWAWADMRSRAGDDEAYFVEGVPWVQYFRGRYALHGTFWHNRFGRRTSHGCINLSAHDARWVYERTSPVSKPGFVTTNEHAVEPGTVLRIRKGTTAPPDRRRPPIGTPSRATSLHLAP